MEDGDECYDASGLPPQTNTRETLAKGGDEEERIVSQFLSDTSVNCNKRSLR